MTANWGMYIWNFFQNPVSNLCIVECFPSRSTVKKWVHFKSAMPQTVLNTSQLWQSIDILFTNWQSRIEIANGHIHSYESHTKAHIAMRKFVYFEVRLMRVFILVESTRAVQLKYFLNIS